MPKNIRQNKIKTWAKQNNAWKKSEVTVLRIKTLDHC